MAVWSIIVAAAGLVGGTISALVMLVIAGNVTAGTSAAVARPAVSAIANTPEVVDRCGFAAADRAAVIEGLSRLQPLTPGQQLQLDELLAESGREVVTTGTRVDPAIVAASVTSSGKLGTLGTADAGGAPSYFVLANGRLELTDGRAVLFPLDGQPPIRGVAYALPDLTSDPGPPPPLSDAAIRSVLRNVTRLNGGRPKGAQVQAMLTLFRGRGQQVVVPMADGSDPAAEVTAASSAPDGTLEIVTSHGGSACTLSVTPAGQVSATINNVPAPPATTVPATGPALGFVVILATMQIAAAVYLLVIGIVTARGSGAGRLLHWFYVGVKLPLGICGVVAAAFLGQSITGGRASAWWTLPAAAGLVYPVSLMFALCSSSLRDYYRPPGFTSDGRRSAPW